MAKEPSHNDQVDKKGEVPPQSERENLGPDDMRAPGGQAREQVEPTQMTAWDGAGNPIKHVFTDDESGHLAEGTGHTTEDAKKEAKTGDTALGPDASPGIH